MVLFKCPVLPWVGNLTVNLRSTRTAPAYHSVGRYYSQHELSGKPVRRNGREKLELSCDHILRTISFWGESFFKTRNWRVLFCLFAVLLLLYLVVVVLMTTERQKLKATAGKISNGLIACK